MDQQIIDGNVASGERLRALIASMTDADLARPLPGGWTIAASLAHLAFWDRRALLLLERWEREGIGQSPIDPHIVNDAMLPQWLALPPRAAALDAAAISDQIDRKVAGLPAERWSQMTGQEDLIRLNRAHHREAHIREIEEALKQR